MYTMRPAEFAYHRPTSLDEALRLLSSGDGEIRPLAGGHSLLPAMKLRLGAPDALVDLSRIPGLDGIESEGDGLRIGALATHASVASSDLVARVCPVLAETAEGIGDRQVRARGTMGGSLAHADPGADYPTVVKALGATVRVQGSGGQRDVAADDFFTGLFATALDEGELVTSVLRPGHRRRRRRGLREAPPPGLPLRGGRRGGRGLGWTAAPAAARGSSSAAPSAPRSRSRRPRTRCRAPR